MGMIGSDCKIHILVHIILDLASQRFQWYIGYYLQAFNASTLISSHYDMNLSI